MQPTVFIKDTWSPPSFLSHTTKVCGSFFYYYYYYYYFELSHSFHKVCSKERVFILWVITFISAFVTDPANVRWGTLFSLCNLKWNRPTVLALLIVITNIKNRRLLDVKLCIKRTHSCTSIIMGKRIQAGGGDTDGALVKPGSSEIQRSTEVKLKLRAWCVSADSSTFSNRQQGQFC